VSGIKTNRDLYLAVADLAGRHGSGARDLEEYLRALWGRTRRLRARTCLSADEFFGLLSAAFTAPAPAFDEAWRSRYPTDDTIPFAVCPAAKAGFRRRRQGPGGAGAPGFTTWEPFVLRQIVDLREMAGRRLLEDERVNFGIKSPRGQWWVNFDPCGFLECAAAGSCGYWHSADDTGREDVPDPRVEDLPCPECGRMTLHEFVGGPFCGACARYVDKGRVDKIARARLNELQAAAREAPDPVVPAGEVSWAGFRHFLGCGQCYE
jgi:hypothetical protein